MQITSIFFFSHMFKTSWKGSFKIAIVWLKINPLPDNKI